MDKLRPFALQMVIRPAAAAVKAQDELAALGLDGGPRRPELRIGRAKEK